jgi:alkylhydroperoxidase family enzyme
MPASWVRDDDTTTLDDLLELTPAAATLRAYRDAVWSDPAGDPLLLELSRLRIAQLLGLDPAGLARQPAAVQAGLDEEHVVEMSRWPTSARFDARQRATLAFAEQWFLDPSGMRDDDCAALRAQLGEPGCAAFTMGLALVEATLRLELALGVVRTRES